MLDTLSQDYVRTARAKGLPRSARDLPARLPQRAAADHHQRRPRDRRSCSRAPSSTETIFSWPGMGRLFIEGVNDRDYFLLMGILFIGRCSWS